MSNRNRPPVRRSSPSTRPMAVPMEQPRKSTGCGGIGAGVLLLALVLVVLLMMLGILPNPLKAPPTATNLPTGSVIEPTEIVEVTSTQGITIALTPTQTQTLPPTATLTPEPSPTFTPTPTEKPMPFVIKGMPKGYPNTMLFPQYACEEYLFIGGEILDLREAPVFDLVVKLGGTYGGSLVDMTSVSGEVTAYGESGFGFVIENQRIRESGITIQLFDANGEALSALTYLSITGNCDSNLVIVNYKQVREIQP